MQLLPPTLCRPRHVDRERLRVQLGTTQFQRLRYHEAAVVSSAPMKFQLVALSGDSIFVLPLAGGGGARCIPLRTVAEVTRVVPATQKQRALLLLPTSQLFRLQLEASELFFATFEPHTQLFFQLARALRVAFQSLVLDLASARDDQQRSRLLDELTVAASSSAELQQLFFENRTPLEDCVGLAAFLVQQLTRSSLPEGSSESQLTFLLSSVRVLGAMCFDASSQTRFLNTLALEELVSHVLARGAECYAVNGLKPPRMNLRILREELLDAQAALLLALDAMQQHEDFRLYQQQTQLGLLHEQTVSVAQLALRAPALATWLSKFFKRVCIAVSRVATAIERQQDEQEASSSRRRSTIESQQALALWRNVSVLELLVEGDAISNDKQVPTLLLHSRKDYIK
ncbi:hypothetical protein BBJ28_00010385 [Nothophytophthora sp. Chile5]|nr:hypothetical protein BBJ28_00010385 [Nothophytophthora sp. Chile5]